MMNLRDAGVVLHERVRSVLVRLSRSRTEEQRLVERAKIVLNGVAGWSHTEQGRELGVDRQRSRRWTVRWLEVNDRLSAAANDPDTSDGELEKMVSAALADKYRSGTTPKFTAEQLARIIALACERVEDLGLPVNRPTPAELAREAVKRDIVESISPRHLDRILKRGGPSAS
jgi:putative transposase